MVKMTVVRPTVISATVKREPGASWGVKMGFQTDCSTCLRIKEGNPGPFQEYNEGAAEDAQIRVNDFIWSTNGFRGAGKDLIEKMRSENEVQLEVLRLPELPQLPAESDT